MATVLTDVQIASTTAWDAVFTRNAAFDGAFVYGVRSTGVYCKPSCGSRRPLRKNVEFYPSASRAEAAGLRACRRCKPHQHPATSSVERRVHMARAYLDANAERRVSLRELGNHAGLSPSHLQRSFARIIGVSPQQYQQVKRLARFKSRLRAGETISRATYDAGFGSISRIYEKANNLLGMTPQSFQRGGRGVRIAYTIVDTQLGRALVATTDRGVCAVEIGSTTAEVEDALRRGFPDATIERDDDAHAAWARAVIDRVRRPAIDNEKGIPLDVSGTDFQLMVWAALQQIPAGERRTYAQVAASIGQPRAARAVARACATNRIAVLVPCHRVIASDGRLSGYKWGTERKSRLLEDESG